MPDEWNGTSSAFKEWVGAIPLIIYRYDRSHLLTIDITIECFRLNRLFNRIQIKCFLQNNNKKIIVSNFKV